MTFRQAHKTDLWKVEHIRMFNGMENVANVFISISIHGNKRDKQTHASYE